MKWFALLIVVLNLCSCAVREYQRPPVVATQQPAKHWLIAVPGLHDDVSRFDALMSQAQNLGYERYRHPLRAYDGTVSIRHLAADLQRSIQQRVAPQDTVTLVGFSMGGLIIRSCVQEYGVPCRVRKIITVGTPNRGTLTAHLLAERGGEEMRAGSEFLSALNGSSLNRLSGIRCVALWSDSDLVVLPASNAMIPGKPDKMFSGIIHGDLMDDPGVLQVLRSEIGISASF